MQTEGILLACQAPQPLFEHIHPTQPDRLDPTGRSILNYRNEIVKEIVESEKSYVNNLKVLIGLYVSPLRAAIDSDIPVVTADDIKVMFSNVELLLNVNTELLADLTQRYENWSDTQIIGDVFLHFAPMFKLYTEYCKQYDKAVTRLQELIETNPAFSSHIELAHKIQDTKNLGVLAFLITPIQRLPRYILLLSELRNHTNVDHKDYQFLDEAVKKFQHVTDCVNDSIKVAEGTSKIIALQKKFIGKNLVDPARRFVFEGRLNKITSRFVKECWFFLFNDILVYAYETIGFYRHKGTIPLATTWIRDLPNTQSVQNVFQIVSKVKTYTVYAETPQLKSKWMSAINDQIDALVELKPDLINERSQIKMRTRTGLQKMIGKQFTYSPDEFDPKATSYQNNEMWLESKEPLPTTPLMAEKSKTDHPTRIPTVNFLAESRSAGGAFYCCCSIL